MKGILFYFLTFLFGGALGLALEKGAAYLPADVARVLTRVHGLGFDTLSISFSICGLVGLLIGYLIACSFVKK